MMFVFTFVPLLLIQVGLLNVGGYYDSLLTLFDNMHAQGFLKFNARTLVVSAPTPAELLDKLEVSVDQDLTPIQMHIVTTHRCCAICMKLSGVATL